MIDLTPLEVRKKKGDFRRAMRGYDPVLVDDFLDLVADRLEELVRENLTLHDRVSRGEQQVADYRDREKALTEALVSAQEMREEVRRQTTREAELAKQSAEQHAAQLRASVEEEARRLRADAQQEVSQLRASVQSQREREEEILRHLHARQEEFFSSYRSLLERELAELAVLARTMNVPTGRGGSEPPPRGPQGGGARAPAAALPSAQAAASRQRTDPAKPGPAAPKPGPAAPKPGPATPKPESAQGGPEPPKRGGGAPTASATKGPEGRAPMPISLAPAPQQAVDEFTGEALSEAEIEDEAALAVGETPSDLEFDAEPFEPEPFLPDADEVDALGGDRVAEAYGAEPPAGAGETDTTEVSGGGSEIRLYDGIAADESGDGVPGPIGLGEPDAPAPWETGWAATGDAAGDLYDLSDTDLDDDDGDTAALLRNAAAAGYRLSDEDLPEELLLEETVHDEEEPGDDDPWLPTLLDDDK